MTPQLVKGLPCPLPRFAIFDLDGTLIDSMPMWMEVDRRLLGARGVADPEATIEDTKTMNLQESADYFIARYRLKDTRAGLMAEMDRMACDAYANTVPLKPHALELLDRLQRQGAALCVATSSSIGQVEPAMRRLDLWNRFRFVLSADEVGVGKSRPDIFVEAARRLGAAPCRVTVFEDTLEAIRSARSAGFRVVGVYDESGAAAAAQCSAESDCFVLDLGQLL